MTRLLFTVPANGRIERTRICLRQLARTCETLTEHGIVASALVAASDENLHTARELGFGTVERENAPLGRKWNDLYQLATDPAFNPYPATHTVPLGSDDWIDPELILEASPLPDDAIVCFRRAAFVREDGQRLAPLRIPYEGGVGIRVIPAALLERVGFRPSMEDRPRAIDTSVLSCISRAHGGMPRIEYRDLHPLQIVDWKGESDQLNSYADCLHYLDGTESRDPWTDLAQVYPLAAVEEMRQHYATEREVAA